LNCADVCNIERKCIGRKGGGLESPKGRQPSTGAFGRTKRGLIGEERMSSWLRGKRRRGIVSGGTERGKKAEAIEGEAVLGSSRFSTEESEEAGKQ